MPRSKEELTALVAEIWNRNLGPKGRAPNANLLRIRVGALRICRMLDDIEKELGVAIPLGTALKLGTVEAIASAIETDRWPPRSPLILLKDGQENGQGGAPLYLLPGGVGLILEVCDLASRINHPGKSWGLHTPGFEGETPELDSATSMAAYLVDNLPDHGDEPINIVGYSFGGLVAIEMARILRERNRRVGLIGMIDGLLPENQWSIPTRLYLLAGRTTARIKLLSRIPAEKRIESLKKIGLLIVKRLAGMFFQHYLLSSAYDQAPARDVRVQDTRRLILIAHDHYVPRPVDFPVVWFKAKHIAAGVLDQEKLWRRIISKLEVIELDGDHTTMILPPVVADLAAKISARLDGAAGRDSAKRDVASRVATASPLAARPAEA